MGAGEPLRVRGPVAGERAPGAAQSRADRPANADSEESRSLAEDMAHAEFQVNYGIQSSVTPATFVFVVFSKGT